MIVISRIFLPKDNKNLYHLIWENRNILVLEERVFMAKNRWRRFNAYVGNKGLVNEYGKKISSKSLIIKKYDLANQYHISLLILTVYGSIMFVLIKCRERCLWHL